MCVLSTYQVIRVERIASSRDSVLTDREESEAKKTYTTKRSKSKYAPEARDDDPHALYSERHR